MLLTIQRFAERICQITTAADLLHFNIFSPNFQCKYSTLFFQMSFVIHSLKIVTYLTTTMMKILLQKLKKLRFSIKDSRGQRTVPWEYVRKTVVYELSPGLCSGDIGHVACMN